jgi:hypothetical protein
MPLHSIQQAFQTYLLSNDDRVNHYVYGPTPEFIDERLSIYGNAYQIRLVDSLAINFTHLQSVMGKEAFEEMGVAYLDKYPSHTFSVRYFGDRLCEFLATTAPYSSQPILYDMALYEWALCHAIDAADAPSISIEDLKAIPQEEWGFIQFQFHPSVIMIELQSNAPDVWQAYHHEQSPPAITVSSELVTWAVWRKHIQAYYRANKPSEAWVMRAIEQDKSFADICEGLCELMPEDEVAQYSVTLLVQWLNDEMFAAVKVVK